MLTRSTLRRATRQMRLYGELGPGRDARTAPPPERRPAPSGKGPARARVWDEARGAHFLREVEREP